MDGCSSMGKATAPQAVNPRFVPIDLLQSNLTHSHRPSLASLLTNSATAKLPNFQIRTWNRVNFTIRCPMSLDTTQRNIWRRHHINYTSLLHSVIVLPRCNVTCGTFKLVTSQRVGWRHQRHNLLFSGPAHFIALPH